MRPSGDKMKPRYSRGGVEFAFLSTSIKSIVPEALECLLDMECVVGHAIRVD